MSALAQHIDVASDAVLWVGEHLKTAYDHLGRLGRHTGSEN